MSQPPDSSPASPGPPGPHKTGPAAAGSPDAAPAGLPDSSPPPAGERQPGGSLLPASDPQPGASPSPASDPLSGGSPSSLSSEGPSGRGEPLPGRPDGSPPGTSAGSRQPLRNEGAMLAGLWMVLLTVDLVLRSQVTNNAAPSQWRPLDAGVYLLGTIWGLSSWYLLALLLSRLGRFPWLRRALTLALAVAFGSCIMVSFAYRLYYYQSPSWQVIKFSIAEPENTRRIILWHLKAPHVAAMLLFLGLIAAVLTRVARGLAAHPPSRPWWASALMLALYLGNSGLTLLAPGFQDPLPVEANSAAAIAQYGLATTTGNKHLVAPVRPHIPPQPPAPRPNVLLIVHESLRADAVFPLTPYSELTLDARSLAPYSSHLPERRDEGFFIFPQARANASATEASLPTILSGLDLGGDPDAYGRVHTVWSLGKATGAKTWLFSAQTYSWSHFDEYFFDQNLDVEKTGLDLAPAYVNDVGVDDILPVDRALEQITQLGAERWVGVIHFSGTHVPGYPGPGIPPDPNDDLRWRQAARYIDSVVAQFMTRFLPTEAARNTVIISTADHGEPLESSRKQRRLGSHYEEVARVPFWIRVPPELSAQHPTWAPALDAWSRRNIQNFHILATVRDALVMADSDDLNRHIFTPSLLRDPGNLPDIVAGNSTCSFRAWWQEGIYLVNGQHKLLLSNERVSPELYDLSTDPAERKNLWFDAAAHDEALRWAIPTILAGTERTAACKRIGKNCILP